MNSDCQFWKEFEPELRVKQIAAERVDFSGVPERLLIRCDHAEKKLSTEHMGLALVRCALTQKGPHQCSSVSTNLQIELPPPLAQDPNAASALQELLGGKYGEMSTLGNYLFQSFNFRSKSKLRPFYSLVAAITAEELGHVELVSNGVAMLNNGPDALDADMVGPDGHFGRSLRDDEGYSTGIGLPFTWWRRRAHRRKRI